MGPVAGIFAAPAHPYTRHLIGEARKLDAGRGLPARAADAVPPILSVRGLSKTYGGAKRLLRARIGGLRAVDDVSFDLHRGENLGIVGESGSGKTTLGRLILRIVEPSSGQVIYHRPDGTAQDVRAMRRAELRRYHAAVRLVFQDPFGSLNPRMTVRQVVGDPLRINRLAHGRALENRVADLLQMVGLSPEMMDRYPHAFSGGQRQRIGIARALALEPRIIIADEATSALDVSIRSQILDLLLALQTRLDLSFLFISHDISVVRYFCDRVAVIHRGRLVEIGSAETICTAPSEPYTRALISAVPSPDPRVKRMMHRTRYDAEA
jgi:peptide/nickel transport system ATP-binding protein